MKTKAKKSTKKQSQINHALGRAAKRLGYDLNIHHLDRMRGLIKRQEAKFLERQSLRVTLWRMSIKGEDVVVAYDKQRQTIITILRLDDNNKEGFQHEMRGEITIEDIAQPKGDPLTAVKHRLKHLYQQMAEMTLPKCKACPLPLSCCSPEYCDITMKVAEEWGETLETTDHETLPLMGPTGCTASPHLRPICTVHTCKINAVGFEIEGPDDKGWNDKYFNLRDRINELEAARIVLTDVQVS